MCVLGKLVLFVAAFACISSEVHGQKCDWMKMSTNVQKCMNSADIYTIVNTTKMPNISDICSNMLEPIMNCIKPDLKDCAPQIDITMVEEYIEKICNGIAYFLNGSSTDKCSINNLNLGTCIANSGFLELGNISSVNDIKSINYYCDGRINTMIKCLEVEISSCEKLFGIPMNLTWLSNMATDLCRFLTKEPYCDVTRLPATGVQCYEKALRVSNVNMEGDNVMGQMCRSSFVPQMIQCLEPNITACGRMMTIKFNTNKMTELFFLYCNNQGDIMKDRNCIVDNVQNMAQCPTTEAEAIMNDQLGYFKTNAFTIETGINKYMCGMMKISETCFWKTVGKCESLKEIGRTALAISVPDGCSLRVSGGISLTVSLSSILIILVLLVMVII